MLWRSFPRFLGRELHANFLKYPPLCSRAGSLTSILNGQLEGDTEQNAEL